MKDIRGDWPTRIAELASELTDGAPTPETVDELRELVAVDPVALEWYCQWMTVHATLHQDLAFSEQRLSMARLTEPHDLALDVTPVGGRARLKSWRSSGAVVAGALAASLAIFAIYHQFFAPSDASISGRRRFAGTDEARREFQRTDNSAVAVLSRIADASRSSSTPLTLGSPLRVGRFVLDSGVVQLEFLSGANLVIEGPADIDLVSINSVVCRRGRIRARVPAQAHGFTIDTPTHRAIDLGTEFAVDVGADKLTEVHVLDGEVRVQDRLPAKGSAGGPAAERLLRLGDAFRSLANGGGAAIKADVNRFIGAERLLALSEQESESRYSTWARYSQSLLENRDVVAYYNFEDHLPWQRVLQQQGLTKNPLLEGAIVGCRWSEGRWRQKQALEFKSTEDRVRINIPGEYQSISLACWVRIDGFDHWLSSLLLTDGHNIGEVHWQLTETGQLLLGVKAEPEKSHDFYSDIVLRPTDVGRWVHLATVYDYQSGEVSHYVDGRRVSSEAIQKHVSLRFGAAEIGNWQSEDFIDHRIRSFNGRMDEFVLFKTALSDDQIQAMYQAGKPSL